MPTAQYTGIDNLELLQDAVHYNRYLEKQVVNAARGTAPVVDFGAGIGTFAAALKEEGLKVICIENDPALLDRLRSQDLEAYPNLDALPPSPVKLIYSLNVLEHIDDHMSILKTMHSQLQPGGRLLLYVPAFNHLFSSMDRKVGHVRRYTRGYLRQLLRQAGFSTVHIRYVDCLGYFASLIYKYVGDPEGDINPGMLRLYDRILFPVSRFLDRLGVHYLFGKNLLAVAECT